MVRTQYTASTLYASARWALGHAVTLTLDLLIPKPNQFIFVPWCTTGKSLVKIRQSTPQILQRQYHWWTHAWRDGWKRWKHHSPYGNRGIKTRSCMVSGPQTHCSCWRKVEMHPCLLKVKAMMSRDCRKTLVYFLCTSNQVSLGVPIAAIVKVRVPSVSGGYGAVDTFLKDRTDAIQRRTCQQYAYAWWASSVFKLLNPKVHQSYWKFPLMGHFSQKLIFHWKISFLRKVTY